MDSPMRQLPERSHEGNTPRPIALVTGAHRQHGIGAAIAIRLAETGWDVACTHWPAYDATMPWHADGAPEHVLADELRRHGARTFTCVADLADVETPARVFTAVHEALGPITALVLNHCHSMDSGMLETDVSAFDSHYEVNVRANWLLMCEYARHFQGAAGRGRIVALTSDALTGNVPYGATKGALDRVTLAAAREFGPRGITANAINPGPTDTGWMTEAQLAEVAANTSLGRVGTPHDCANLVAFLCSADGGWITGQLLHSNGGLG